MPHSSPAENMWIAAGELLREAGSLSDSQLAFVRMAHPLSFADDVFIVAVGSDFVRTWILDHVAGQMTKILSDIVNHPVTLKIAVDPSVNEMPPASDAVTHEPAQGSASAQPSLRSGSPSDSRPDSPSDLSPDSRAESLSTSPSDSPSRTFPPYASDLSSVPVDEPGRNGAEGTNTQANHQNTQPARSEGARESAAPVRDNRETHNHEARRHYHQPSQPWTNARLNPKYTFDSFVIGESNRFAAATSLAVAETPGTTYNPLFLYSDSGMGKTHLMHAIGNYALDLFQDIRVRYASAEEFTNEFINALRDGTQAQFKDQFRNVDILLIDDIQFIGGRDSTVEEFFHTFNALTNANKQIVITSDVAPNLLHGFEERMISRFSSGVTAAIDRPNLETRIAILDKKAALDDIVVPREVQEYIATNMTTNVREMEGALRRVTAFADLSDQAVDLQLAELVLKDMISSEDSLTITASLIMAQTASYFQISIDDLTGTDRSRSLVLPRQIAMYLAREMTDLSLPKIGSIFGGRDHTTVMHAYRKIDRQMAEKQTIFNQVSELTTRIKQAAQHGSSMA
ncbi:MAG: chromosomal replication initiator protein DnaA [Actinomycetaceae bacterium]|nr:chromosomal replication initiator protein DnaA [Actinomycetaceae bacterium]